MSLPSDAGMPAAGYPVVQRWAGVGVFIFFGGMLAVPSGYSAGGVVLLLTALWFLSRRPSLGLDAADRLMVATLLGYFLVASGMTWLLGNNPTDVDQYSRALLAVPILLLLCRVPVRPHVLWGSVVLGVVLAAPLAWWQIHVLGYDRASGFLNIIHFSNLCLLFSGLCAGGWMWAGLLKRSRVAWRVAFLLAGACGAYGSIVGGSRASWLALPFMVIVFLVSFLSRRNVLRMLASVAVLAAVLAGLFAMPGSPLSERYEIGVRDVTEYQQDETNTSIGARFEMWRGAWNNLQRHPVLGWNVQAYTQALRQQVADGELTQTALEFNNNLHNNYFQAWVFTGLPGLLALLALYGVPLWQFTRRLRAPDLTVRVWAYCGALVVVSYVIFSLTQVILRRNNGIMFYLLAVVIFWGGLKCARIASGGGKGERGNAQ